jgi:hypothetical protein
MARESLVLSDYVEFDSHLQAEKARFVRNHKGLW